MTNEASRAKQCSSAASWCCGSPPDLNVRRGLPSREPRVAARRLRVTDHDYLRRIAGEFRDSLPRQIMIDLDLHALQAHEPNAADVTKCDDGAEHHHAVRWRSLARPGGSAAARLQTAQADTKLADVTKIRKTTPAHQGWATLQNADNAVANQGVQIAAISNAEAGIAVA